jgi:hypothetical protein
MRPDRAYRQAKIDATNAADDAQCRNYGAVPGTQTYTECRMIIAMRRQDIEAANDMQRRAILGNAGRESAAAWPVVAWAQQPAVSVIAFLNAQSADESKFLIVP